MSSIGWNLTNRRRSDEDDVWMPLEIHVGILAMRKAFEIFDSFAHGRPGILGLIVPFAQLDIK